MGKFLDFYLPNLSQEVAEHLNRPVTIKKIEVVIKFPNNNNNNKKKHRPISEFSLTFFYCITTR